jgi:RNA polymerase sigma-70 factor (ECF subfamily)
MSHGDELERLYDLHAQALFAYLLNLTRNEHDTKDALQEVFIRVARDPNLLNDARDPRAFLIRLAHNVAVDFIRRRGSRDKKHEAFGEDRLPLFAQSSDADEQTFRCELAGALAALPQDQRVVVHLKLWEGMTFEAIAETLEIPLNTAASRYRYGLDKLRDLLRPLYEEIN